MIRKINLMVILGLSASLVVNWYECTNFTTGRRVTSLNLSSQRLSGPIPDFGSMDALLEIDFHNNSLNGPIPDFLGSLPNLELLDLSGNRLTGSTPTSLSNNENLTLKILEREGEKEREWGRPWRWEYIASSPC